MSTIVVKNSSKTILDSLREDFNIPLDASCGGKGTCGKCRVRIAAGEVDPPGAGEMKYLTEKDLEQGIRLACYIKPESELHVDVDHHAGPVKILEDHGGFNGRLDLPVKKIHLKMDKPQLDDQRDDLTRLRAVAELENLHLPLPLVQSLPSLLKNNDYEITAVYNDREILALEGSDTTDRNYAVACDIGTTTVVTYLLDGATGEILGTASDLNAQKPFGADVIARIDFVKNNNDGLEILQRKKLNQLESLIKSLLDESGVDPRFLYSVTVAGNTTMLHLLAGVDPTGIAAAPFIPGFLDSFTCRAGELGDFFTDCLIHFMPSISAYVGSDIVAGVQATDMFETDELTLLVDLGTNGEIILGNREGFISCSTAAGPAFEGAHIQYGMGAVSGAINKIFLKDGGVDYTVLESKAPRGICGSAIVDITAELLREGIIDETGRFADDDELRDGRWGKRLLDDSFVIATSDESASGSPLLFTQKDVREIQLAKAAVAAGIETLLHEAGKEKSDIANLYIAGGFGNYINRESAAAMGLIPAELLDRTSSVGNTAGLGAINCALDRNNHEICREIVRKTEYVELSAHSWFQMKYMEEMTF